MTEGADVEVARRDGTSTTVRIARLGSPFQLNGETWVDADWSAARGIAEQADYGPRRDTDERTDRTAQEKREFAQRQALERARRRQQTRHRHAVRTTTRIGASRSPESRVPRA
jgi:hypothetical protein